MGMLIVLGRSEIASRKHCRTNEMKRFDEVESLTLCSHIFLAELYLR